MPGLQPRLRLWVAQEPLRCFMPRRRRLPTIPPRCFRRRRQSTTSYSATPTMQLVTDISMTSSSRATHDSVLSALSSSSLPRRWSTPPRSTVTYLYNPPRNRYEKENINPLRGGTRRRNRHLSPGTSRSQDQ